MYAVAVNGSPRPNGNTHLLLEAVLKPLKAAGWDTELYQVGGKEIRGCLGCFKCWETKDNSCILKKDCFHDVFGKMLKADAIIIGSPTYYASMNAETKALVDRSGFVSRANDNAFKWKIGAAVAAVRRAGAIHVVEGINRMYLINGMIIPGSTYWNLGIGLEKGEAEEDEEGMENMADLGSTIAVLGTALKSLRSSEKG